MKYVGCIMQNKDYEEKFNIDIYIYHRGLFIPPFLVLKYSFHVEFTKSQPMQD